MGNFDVMPLIDDVKSARANAREALLVLAYCGLFMAYNFAIRESESLHWVSLVLLPLALVYLYARRVRGAGLRGAFASVGLRRGNLTRGLPLALPAGLALGLLQVLISDRRDAIWQIIVSGKVIIALPLVIVLLALTAGFTEEFFFRGVLQTRLARWWHSEVWALLAASLLFGLYHFPYVFFKAGSALRGNPWGALGECGYDALAGVILGVVYWKSRKNLFAAVTVHVLIDALPVMTMVHIGLHPKGGASWP